MCCVRALRLRDIVSTQGKKRCIIIAISSNDEETIIARAKAAGCDHYLIKPALSFLLLTT